MAFPSPTSLPVAEDPLIALQSLAADPLSQLVSLLLAEAPSPTYPHAVGGAPLEGLVAPSAVPPPSPSRQGGGVHWGELLKMVLPVVGELTSGSRRGAFLTGFMHEQEAREARRREQADEQLRLSDAQERRDQARDTQRRQQLQLQDRFIEDVAQRAADATTPEEHEDILRQYEPIESQYGLTPGSTRTRVRFNATKAERTRRAEAKAAVNDLRTRWKGQFYTPEFQSSSVVFRNETVPLSRLRTIAGDYDPMTADGTPVGPTSGRTTTFGDLWPAAKGTAFATHAVPLDTDGFPDLKEGTEIARQNGWINTASERQEASTRYRAQLREQITDAMRVPGSVDAAALQKRVQAAGLNWDQEKHRAAVAVDKERRDAARSGQLLEGTADFSDEEPAAASARRMREAEDRLRQLTEGLGGARPAAGPPAGRANTPARAAGPGAAQGSAGSKTITRAELRAAMQRLGAQGMNLTDAEAERQYRARGFTVIP